MGNCECITFEHSSEQGATNEKACNVIFQMFEIKFSIIYHVFMYFSIFGRSQTPESMLFAVTVETNEKTFWAQSLLGLGKEIEKPFHVIQSVPNTFTQ